MQLEKLRAAIEESGYRKGYIAEQIGVSNSTFTAMLNGTRKITADEYIKICRIIRRSPADFTESDPSDG